MLTIFGFRGGYAGGQAEYVRIAHADYNLLKIPDSVPDEKVRLLPVIKDRLIDRKVGRLYSFPTSFLRLIMQSSVQRSRLGRFANLHIRQMV
jgi:hypothetical protein